MDGWWVGGWVDGWMDGWIEGGSVREVAQQPELQTLVFISSFSGLFNSVSQIGNPVCFHTAWPVFA